MAFNWNPFSRAKNDGSKKVSFNAQPSSGAAANTNFGTFSKINSDIEKIISAKSVVDRAAAQYNSKYANPSWQTFFEDDLLATPLATNKPERLAQYRRISRYNKCNWCLDEIADDFLHDDEHGNFINMRLPQRLNSIQQDILQNEFKKFISLFNFRDNAHTYVKKFLIEGELAWENVINPKYPDMGIIGVKLLPCDYYETLVDIKTGKPVGLVFDVESFSKDSRDYLMNSINMSAQIFNTVIPTTYTYKFTQQNCIPMLWSQLTYVNTGEYSFDNKIVYPLLEEARQTYQRLALLEDACVILRVTHAPERLLFNVSTGTMDQNRADEYVRRFAMELKSKKTASPGGEDVVGVYNPVSMLKSYIFAKSSQSEGTTVESVGSQVSYNEMEDVEYFLREFFKTMKIPWSRYKTPENTIEKNDSITYEEHSFMRQLIRFQRRFAAGLKQGFINHLKLRDLWSKDEYMLKDSDIDIEFVKPILYDVYEQQKLAEVKMAIYKLFADQDEMSKMLAMKKYLGFTDKDVEENYTMLIKEKQMTAVGDYFADSITADNPPVDFKSPIRRKSDVQEEEQINANQTTIQNGEDSATEGAENAQESTAPGENAEQQEETSSEESSEEPEIPTFGLES